MDIDPVLLRRGAEDFRYLMGRGYPRKSSLELVGNRYDFRKDERELLHRGVFSPADAARRREKLLGIAGVSRKPLAVDGYNVLITVEAAFRQKPLVLADDGVIRDISGVSAAYKMRDVTLQAVEIIVECLKASDPERVVFLFDSPISRSGRLAEHVADRLRAAGLAGESRAVKVPEQTLIGYPGVVATSDSAIIDRVAQVIDLAGHIIRERIPHSRLIEL